MPPARRRRVATRRAIATCEIVEPRRLLAWGAHAQLIGQDDAASAYASVTGKGQTIAMIDTGIDYNVAALGGGFGKGKKVVAGYDFADSDSNPMDTDGHGTMTASLVAGNRFTNNGLTYQGIAPDARLVALRVSNGSGTIPDSRIARALKWVVDHHDDYDIGVVNISLGGGSSDDVETNSTLSKAFADLAKLDIIVVSAAGNDGDDEDSEVGVAYPGSDANVLSIGAVDDAGHVADFSQRGRLLDLLAPGEGVVAVNRGGAYQTIDGTSFSTPIVSGALALLRQVAPDLRIADLSSVLQTSGQPEFDGDNEGGRTTDRYYARLDLPNAIKLAQSRQSASLSSIAATKNTTLDVAYDASGVLHIAYYDAAKRRLMYATQRADGRWTTPQRVDGTQDVGKQLSIAISGAGKPAIAYFDATNSDLKYAILQPDGRWQTSRVDGKNSTGQYPSIGFDADGDPTVAYYRKSGGDLRLATLERGSDSWTLTTPDAGGSKKADVGAYASLATYQDSDGSYSLAIAYADVTNGDLKYIRHSDATTENNGWYSSVVEKLDGVANINLQLVPVDANGGTTGQAHIAYQDARNANVKFAWRDTDWFTKTLASTGNVGQSINGYTDARGDYHVVYYDRTKATTFDARIDVGDHSVDKTTKVGSVGQRASVAANAAGVGTLVGLNKAGKSFGATVLQRLTDDEVAWRNGERRMPNAE